MPRASFARLVARPRTALAVVFVVTAISSAFASRLELRTDFASLLPRSASSVQDFEAIKERVASMGTMFVLIEAPDAATREKAAVRFAEAIQALEGDLLAEVLWDDREARDYYWEHRYLFVDLAELREVDEALAERARDARLDANPLYIDLEDDPPADAEQSFEERLDDIQERLDRARAQHAEPSSFVSRDGSLQLVLVRASFEASNVGDAKILVSTAETIAADLGEELGVRIGLTGTVVTALGEHESILRGMLTALFVTCILVTLVLIWHLRSLWVIGAVVVTLGVGCALAFGLTFLIVGHLNLATAFFAAIVVGNGINPSIIIASRYLEERRGGRDVSQLIEAALRGSLPGTLAASLTGAVAYGSLIVTDFRGFRHFGVIGGIGMVTCWIAAYTCLPALLALAHERLPQRRPQQTLAWLRHFASAGSRAGVVVLVLLTVVAGAASLHYVLSDPLETDWRNLRSLSEDVLVARDWNDRLSNEFERGFNRNLSGQFVIAGDTETLTRQAAAAISNARESAGSDSTIGAVRTSAEVWPPQQDEKLEVLASIRTRIDDILPELDDDEAATVRELRPPDTARAIPLAEVPDILRMPFTEKDGRFGRIAWASSSDRVQSWNVRDLVDFAADVRYVERPEGSLVAGQAFIFADMLDAMERDIPRATLVVIFGAILCVLVMVGPRRWGWTVLASSALGTLGMIAIAGAVGLEVNFLDFIALPITVGIGVDYAANLAARARHDSTLGSRALLTSVGGAVVVCSLTTIIGYGSLLLSENAGIRSFGLASVIGEFTCLIAALWLVPLAMKDHHKRDCELSPTPSSQRFRLDSEQQFGVEE